MTTAIHDTAEQLIAKAISRRVNTNPEHNAQATDLLSQVVASLYPETSEDRVLRGAMLNSIDAKLRKAEEQDTADLTRWIEVGQMDLFNTDSHKLPPWISDPEGHRQRTLDASLARVRADMQARVELAATDRDKLAEQWNRMKLRTEELERYLATIDQLVRAVRENGLDPEQVTYADILRQAEQANGRFAVTAQPTPARPVPNLRAALER